jgi:GntR family transcriptional regulator, transcriptional repressor for pyruvate dehydrogenase complex
MFRPVKPNRAFEDVVTQIQGAILQGGLKPGDRLQGERHLREIFQVSRGTLREALRTLEQKKLIQIKTGTKGGAIVCHMDTQPMSESLDLLLRYQRISLRELAEFREAIEGLVAAMAAKKVKKTELKCLMDSLDSIRKYLGERELRWDEILAEDKKFHLSIASLIGNRIFESILSTIYENIYGYFDRFLPMERETLETLYQDLCKITQALREKNATKAHTLAQTHVRRFTQMVGDKKLLKQDKP